MRRLGHAVDGAKGMPPLKYPTHRRGKEGTARFHRNTINEREERLVWRQFDTATRPAKF